MKKLHVLYACVNLVCLILLSSCDATTDSSSGAIADVFQVHLQSWFSHTRVIVSVDGSQVYADTVSTSLVLGVASIIPVKVTQGTHSLKVTISNAVTKDTTFTIVDTLYAAVGYDSVKSAVNIYFTRNKFLYD